jgi:hypothetical protein
MRFRAIALLFVLWGAVVGAQNADGKLNINDHSYDLKHAYAFQVPDVFDKEKMATKVLVTDREVPEKLLKAKFNIFDLGDAGITGLSLEFFSEGSSYSLNLISSHRASVSLSGSFDRELVKTLEPDRIEVAGMQDDREFGSTTMSYQLSFGADVAPHVVVPPYVPNQADMDAAAKAESTKAYLAFHEAMGKGDIDAIRGMVVPERAEMMNDPDFKEMFAFVQEMMAKDVKVLRAVEEGDEAELLLTGTMMGEENSRGKVDLQRINGKWLIGMESWGDIE